MIKKHNHRMIYALIGLVMVLFVVLASCQYSANTRLSRLEAQVQMLQSR